MPQRFCLLLLLFGVLLPGHAQPRSAVPSESQPVVRYHFGDNPAWAAPTFDDSAWPVAKNGAWPIPSMRSSGFVWVRMQIPVPPASTTPLAVMLRSGYLRAGAEQVYFQGVLIGHAGQLPPRPAAVVRPSSNVFAVPTGLAATPVATIAFRLWYPPIQRYLRGEDDARVRLGPAPLFQSEQRADHLSGILAFLPDLLLNSLLGLVGVGLFVLWYWSRRRGLFWFSLLLIAYPFELLPGALGVFLPHPLPVRIYELTYLLADCMGMPVAVEFLRSIFNIRTRWFRIILHPAWMVFVGGMFFARVGLSQTLSPFAIAVVLHVGFFALYIFNYGTILINLRYLISGPQRAIAFGMMLVPIGSITEHLGIELALFHIPLFFIGFILAGFAIAALLVRQAIASWRQGDLLRGEIAAAREVQQQLVPLDLPVIPGCQLEAVYLPAAEVGGDFYQVLPLPGGSALIIVGDVSGKGLKAAMTGTLAIGALRTIAMDQHNPAALLQKLNQQSVRAKQGGFITCLCAHITPNGTLTVANAGHLSPYRNGEEIPLDSGLPLGITEAAEYTETTLQLAPGDSLTFLSDGVIEARNPSGELYGFERTQAISRQTAEAIAQAAQHFGQEDDITVLTLTLAAPV